MAKNIKKKLFVVSGNGCKEHFGAQHEVVHLHLFMGIMRAVLIGHKNHGDGHAHIGHDGRIVDGHAHIGHDGRIVSSAARNIHHRDAGFLCGIMQVGKELFIHVGGFADQRAIKFECHASIRSHGIGFGNQQFVEAIQSVH